MQKDPDRRGSIVCDCDGNVISKVKHMETGGCFLSLDIEEQLRDILEHNKLGDQLGYRFLGSDGTTLPTVIRVIYDGRCYHEFKKGKLMIDRNALCTVFYRRCSSLLIL